MGVGVVGAMLWERECLRGIGDEREEQILWILVNYKDNDCKSEQ